MYWNKKTLLIKYEFEVGVYFEVLKYNELVDHGKLLEKCRVTISIVVFNLFCSAKWHFSLRFHSNIITKFVMM